MHLKVFLKLKKPQNLSLMGKYIKKTKKHKKNKKQKKNKKKNKKPLVWFFLYKKTGFFPTLAQGALCVHGALLQPGRGVLAAAPP